MTATEGKSVTMHKQFWKDYDIHKTLKNTDASLCRITASKINGVWKQLSPQISHDFQEFEKAKDSVIWWKHSGKCTWLCQKISRNSWNVTLRSWLTRICWTHARGRMRSLRGIGEQPWRFNTKQMTVSFSMVEKAMACSKSQDSNTEKFI